MAVEIKHKFQSAKADSSDPSIIRPSNWNDVHAITMQTARLLGRYSVGNGDAQEISLGSGLQFSGGALALSATLSAISALVPTDDNFIVGDGATWQKLTPADARTALGLGTAAVLPSTDFALSATTITAGNGLTGGGSLAANRTLALGTPSTLGANSTNAVTATTHTHQVDWGPGIASVAAGAVGSFAFAYSPSISSMPFGSTHSGASLFPGSTNSGGNDSAPTALTGTWRCLGYKNSSSGFYTVFLRIS